MAGRKLIAIAVASALCSGGGLRGQEAVPAPITWVSVPLRMVEHQADFPEATNAVVVQRGDLVHTRQFSGLDVGKGDFGFGDLVGQLKGVCRAHGVGLEAVVKLNLYVASEEPDLMAAIQSGLEEHFSSKPAITLVPSTLPGGATLAADAVIRSQPGKSNRVERFERDAATMPAGRDILYVSGRAAREGTLGEATAGTMAQLLAVIGELGCEPSDVVQVKAFLQPMSDWEETEVAIEKAFGELGAPPMVFVEWTSKLPTEIELIAAAPERAETTETVTFFTPADDKPSPVFSRVARVHGDRVIYLGGLHADHGKPPLVEMKRVFARLGDLGHATGSDLRHLAKATYYVSDDELSRELNEIRPKIYDPERPPAASKVTVRSVGRPGAGLLMDFIAVPGE